MTLVQHAVDGQLTDPQLWVPVAEAARRQAPPISRAAMHKRVANLRAAGRLSTQPGPRGTVLVNIVALNRAIAAETDPAQELRNRRAPATLLDVDDDGDAADDTAALPGAGGANYHKSRAEREAYQAENARLDLDERLDRLTDKADVERRTMTAFRKLRDRLLSFPATVADRAASAPDVTAVRNLLATEMRRMLDHLANELDHLEDDADDDDDAGEPGGD